jgi:hypothetical protein
MKTGLKEVARLGTDGLRYPHVLADAHNWCLRLGPNPKIDDKYYSSVPGLLKGLLEQGLRRSMLQGQPVRKIQELLSSLQCALFSMVEIGCRLDEILKKSLRKPARHLGPLREGPISSEAIPVSARSFNAIPGA